MKNLLTQWEAEEENRMGQLMKKPPNPDGTSKRNFNDYCQRVKLSKDETLLKNLLT